MGQTNRQCRSCGYFKAYYTRGYCCLVKENNGLCMKHNKTMQKNEYCDNWRYRSIPKEKRIRIAINSIPEIYYKISVIEQILQEDIELSKKKSVVR